MATLIAHATDSSATTCAKNLGELLTQLRGVTVSVQELSRASRYLDNVDALIVVAPATEETFDRGARNFLMANHADVYNKSVFVAAISDTGELSTDQQASISAFSPRETGVFQTDRLAPEQLKHWAGVINTRGAI